MNDQCLVIFVLIAFLVTYCNVSTEHEYDYAFEQGEIVQLRHTGEEGIIIDRFYGNMYNVRMSDNEIINFKEFELKQCQNTKSQ